MRKLILAAAATATLAMAASATTPASALTIGANAAALQNVKADRGLVTDVRWRRGWHHGGWHHRGGGWGPAVAAGIAGLAIGGALASQPRTYYVDPGYAAAPYGPSVAWCEQHYRSYDPASQTYLGYDGVRHSCP